MTAIIKFYSKHYLSAQNMQNGVRMRDFQAPIKVVDCANGWVFEGRCTLDNWNSSTLQHCKVVIDPKTHMEVLKRITADEFHEATELVEA